MGAANSKGQIPLKQSEQDLHWVLQENVKWNDRSSAAKLLLDGTMIGRGHGTGVGPTESGAGTLDAVTTRIFQEVDLILAEGSGSTAIQTKPSLKEQLMNASSSSSSVPLSTASNSSYSGSIVSKSTYGVGSNTDIFDMEEPIILPMSHPAHQLQASQYFGIAATKEVIAMAKENKLAGNGNSSLSDWTRHGFDNLNDPSSMNQELLFKSTPRGTGRRLASGASSSTDTSLSDKDRRLSTGSVDGAELNTGIQQHPHQQQQLSGPTVSNPHDPLTVGRIGSGTIESKGAISNVDGSSITSTSSTGPALGFQAKTSTLPSSQVEATGLNASKERIELATKYLYIHSLLQKMISSAQISYQVSLQCETLRKKLKPKRTRNLSESQINEMRSSFEQKLQVVRDSRELFLKSRLTLQWFYRDFDLNYGLHILHDAEVWTQKELQSLPSDLASSSSTAIPLSSASDIALDRRHSVDRTGSVDREVHSTTGGHVDPSAPLPAHTGFTRHQLDHILSNIETRRTALEMRLMANERYALSIAHYYLSKHSEGAGLRLEDVADMDPSFFNLMDFSHSHQVTREDLHISLIRLSEMLDSLNSRTRALQQHNEVMTDGGSAVGVTHTAPMAAGGLNQNVLTSNATKITKLQAELAETRKTLQFLYNYFLQTFTRNIFVNLDQNDLLHPETLDAAGLRSDLGAVDGAPKALNPLDLANQGVVGPNEIVKAHNVGSGAPAGIVASSATGAAPTERLQRETGLLSPGSIAMTGKKGAPSDISALYAKTNKPLPSAPMPSVAQLAMKANDHSNDFNTNGALAPKISSSDLSHPSLHHLTDSEIRHSVFGGHHDARMPELPADGSGTIPLAELVVATAWQTPRLAHQLTPIAEVVTPSPYGGQHEKGFMHSLSDASVGVGSGLSGIDERTTIPASTTLEEHPIHATSHLAATGSVQNARLAAIVKKKDLDSVDLEHPNVPLHETTGGSVHAEGALPTLPPSPKMLQDQASSLKHVSWKKAQLTPSGGLHALTKANMRRIPEQVYAPDHEDAATNTALARIVQPDALKTEIKHLDHVPIEYQRETMSGGIHMNDSSAHIKPSLLDRAKNAVGLEPAVDTTAPELGHVVKTKKSNTHATSSAALPAATFAGVGAGAGAAGITERELKSEKRSLDHVPIEYQRETMSGGVHMNDQSAALHPTLMDRAKNAVGLQPGLNTTAPELGRVVEAEKGQHPAISASELRSEKRSLDHVPIEYQRQTMSGGIHMNDQAAALHPSMVDRAKNAVGLQPGLDTTAPELGRVVETDHSRNATIVDRDLKREKKQLDHVPIEWQRETMSGGVHMNDSSSAVKPSIMDRAKHAVGLEPSVNRSAPELGRVVEIEKGQHPAISASELRSEKRSLDHVPIEYQRQTMSGGIHMNDQSAALHPSMVDRTKHAVGLQPGLDTTAPELGRVVEIEKGQHPAISDRELRSEKRSLDHVPIEYQRQTMSGGVHMNDQSAALHPTIVDRAKNAVGLQPNVDTTASELGRVVETDRGIVGKDLKSEKKHLDHVPIELQRETMSGGIHMNDESAAVKPSIVDRAKMAVGLQPSVDTTAPELGHVVKKGHTRQGSTSAIVQQESVPYSQNASLANKVTSSELIDESRHLHHVPIERIEQDRERQLGVGTVMTHREPSLYQPGDAYANLAGAFDVRPTSASSSSAPSLSNSPRQSGLGLASSLSGDSAITTVPMKSSGFLPDLKPSAHQTEADWLKTGVPTADTHTSMKERQGFDATDPLARERNTDIQYERPQRQTMTQ